VRTLLKESWTLLRDLFAKCTVTQPSPRDAYEQDAAFRELEHLNRRIDELFGMLELIHSSSHNGGAVERLDRIEQRLDEVSGEAGTIRKELKSIDSAERWNKQYESPNRRGIRHAETFAR